MRVAGRVFSVNSKIVRSRLLWGVLALGLATTSAVSAASSGDIAVVVRPDNPVDSLSLAETRKVVLGDRQYWTGSLRVTLLVRAPTSHERDVLLRTIYRMTESEYRQYWISRVFRAESSTGPKIVYSNSMADELVLAIPGSVAFVDAKDVPRGMKVLRIDGMLPGDAGYPLK